MSPFETAVTFYAIWMIVGFFILNYIAVIGTLFQGKYATRKDLIKDLIPYRFMIISFATYVTLPSFEDWKKGWTQFKKEWNSLK